MEIHVPAVLVLLGEGGHLVRLRVVLGQDVARGGQQLELGRLGRVRGRVRVRVEGEGEGEGKGKGKGEGEGKGPGSGYG